MLSLSKRQQILIYHHFKPEIHDFMYLTSLCSLKKKKNQTNQKTHNPKPPITTATQQILLLNCLVTGIVQLLPISLDLWPSRYKTIFFFFAFFSSCNF